MVLLYQHGTTTIALFLLRSARGGQHVAVNYCQRGPYPGSLLCVAVRQCKPISSRLLMQRLPAIASHDTGDVRSCKRLLQKRWSSSSCCNPPSSRTTANYCVRNIVQPSRSLRGASVLAGVGRESYAPSLQKRIRRKRGEVQYTLRLIRICPEMSLRG